MKYLIAIALALFTTVVTAQSVEVTFMPPLTSLYFCLEEDKSRCVMLRSDGTVQKRIPPVGRMAINYDMQNYQWSKQNARALPEGDERDSWLEDMVYWNTRLLADKAYALLAAAPFPPAFATIEVVEAYRAQYAEKAKEVLLLESFGLPFHEPVGN